VTEWQQSKATKALAASAAGDEDKTIQLFPYGAEGAKATSPCPVLRDFTVSAAAFYNTYSETRYLGGNVE